MASHVDEEFLSAIRMIIAACNRSIRAHLRKTGKNPKSNSLKVEGVYTPKDGFVVLVHDYLNSEKTTTVSVTWKCRQVWARNMEYLYEYPKYMDPNFRDF